MRKILLLHFGGLENYGTGMMGLISATELHKMYNGNVEIHCDFMNDSTIDDVKSELVDDIKLVRHQDKEKKHYSNKLLRVITNMLSPFSREDVKQYDEIIILGGDDISEYYTKNIFLEILKYWYWSLKSPVTLLGQSIGPFNLTRNRIIAKLFLGKINIIARDGWTKEYLKTEFGVGNNVYQGADLAFKDLPLQSNNEIREEVLSEYKLVPNEYFTVVISGLQGKYYTSNKENFYKAYEEIIKTTLDKYSNIKKVCLLAHTFPPHGNESIVVKEFASRFTYEYKNKVVVVSDKVNQARARFILGNGKFTITGRMHASVSTFQMGKPAISLSYSAKYQGVIGMNLNRKDLIIESNDPTLWDSGEIINLVNEKVDYVIDNYNELTSSIELKVAEQKEIVDICFQQIKR